MVLADYTFWDALWSLFVFFLWVAWFILLFHIVIDVFRRDDASGWKKAAWLVFILFVPFIGVFVYLILNSDDMARRGMQQAAAARQDTDAYIRSVAGGSRLRDRKGEGTARQRRHHPGRVRRDQSQGARHVSEIRS